MITKTSLLLFQMRSLQQPEGVLQAEQLHQVHQEPMKEVLLKAPEEVFELHLE